MRSPRIQNVIKQNQFSIAYQPIWSADLVVGLECLARFAASPSRPPDIWFSEAADLDLGTKLELAAMRKALEALLLVPHPLYQAVNLSPRTILKGGVSQALRGFPLHRIVLEVTEHDSIQDYPRLSQPLDHLRSLKLELGWTMWAPVTPVCSTS